MYRIYIYTTHPDIYHPPRHERNQKKLNTALSSLNGTENRPDKGKRIKLTNRALLRDHFLGQRGEPDGEEALGEEKEEEDGQPRDGRQELQPHEREPLDAQLLFLGGVWVVRVLAVATNAPSKVKARPFEPARTWNSRRTAQLSMSSGLPLEANSS